MPFFIEVITASQVQLNGIHLYYIYNAEYIYILYNIIIDCNEGYIPSLLSYYSTMVVPITNPNCTPKFGIKLSVNH